MKLSIGRPVDQTMQRKCKKPKRVITTKNRSKAKQSKRLKRQSNKSKQTNSNENVRDGSRVAVSYQNTEMEMERKIR